MIVKFAIKIRWLHEATEKVNGNMSESKWEKEFFEKEREMLTNQFITGSAKVFFFLMRVLYTADVWIWCPSKVNENPFKGRKMMDFFLKNLWFYSQAAITYGTQKIFYIYALFNRQYLQIGRSIMFCLVQYITQNNGIT